MTVAGYLTPGQAKRSQERVARSVDKLDFRGDKNTQEMGRLFRYIRA